MGLTTDPNDLRLGRGQDDTARKQNEAYLVLSVEEIAKGFVRPVRRSYVHVGAPGPQFYLEPLTEQQQKDHAGMGYVGFERYPPEMAPKTGRYWTQKELDAADKGCGGVTTMAPAIAETYARDPYFYGSTYCVGCGMHRRVGLRGEFLWEGTQERVGT
jgi:hypothetical protein